MKLKPKKIFNYYNLYSEGLSLQKLLNYVESYIIYKIL